MADSRISGSDNMFEHTTAASTASLIYAVPDNLIQTILQHLSASDLCHVASCCCWLRNATNQDSLWRPLCQSKGWEHFGTTTDLAKIASYGPSKQATDASGARDNIVTFQKDRIVTDDNTAGLTSTCRWKVVYMRAHHLERNWAANCFHFKGFDLERQPSWKRYRAFVDGDLLAFRTSGLCDTIQVYDIRKETLQCVIPSRDTSGDWPLDRSNYVLRDGVIVTPYSGTPIYAHDARTGKLLQKIAGNWGHRIPSLFFDGELIISYVHSYSRENSKMFRDIYVWCVEDGQLQRILTVDPTDSVCVCYNVDYRNKMVAAVYDDDYIRVWDARSGECLHKLECPGNNSEVKLCDNVIVGFSQAFYEEWCDVIIWSQNTGECQKVLPSSRHHRYQVVKIHPSYLVVNNLIMVQGFKRDSTPDDPIHSLCVYNLSTESITEMVNHSWPTAGNGSKRVCIAIDKMVEGKAGRVVFNATPNGLVRLFDVGGSYIIWIDEIRMIFYDEKERRFIFHHYW